MVDKLMSSPEVYGIILFVVIAGSLIHSEYLIAKGVLEDKLPIPAQIFAISLLPVCVIALIIIIMKGI